MALKILNEQMLHGGDYNPDQWLDRPDVLQKDIEYMKQTRVNAVSLGIFAWSALEPEEGRYELDWMQKIIDSLYQNGIYTVLATPSGARPVWMGVNHPEVLRVGPDLVRNSMGVRHNHCYTSPYYRQKVWDIDKLLSQRFGQHPGVILWHISNEYSGACYCPLCIAEFRRWLKKKYGTIQRLNAAWWTAFWSHTYNDFEEIDPPLDRGEHYINGLTLDWKRFVSDRTHDFMAWEKQAIRAGGSTVPVTTNFMGFYRGLNYFQFKDVTDIVSWDNYPLWHTPEGNEPMAIDVSMTHDYMRSILDKPFLMMESSPGPTNWQPVCNQKRPGVLEMTSLHAVAHGSNSVQYFQWRASRGCHEKFHASVVGHDGTNQTRMFHEVEQVGKRLAGLSRICHTSVRARTAIIFDRENFWALDGIAGNLNPEEGKSGADARHYYDLVKDNYAAFWHMGIGVDIVDSVTDLSKYSLVIAPMLYLERPGVVENLRRFTENGGTLVGTYLSGISDENDLCFECFGPNGLQDVFGLESRELDCLYPSQHNFTEYAGRRYELSDMCDVVKVSTAEVMAVYGSDYYQGYPVLTRHPFGKGCAYYLSSRPEPQFFFDFYNTLADKIGLSRALGHASIPAGVSATVRENEEEAFLFVINYNETAAEITPEKPLRNLETGETETVITLPPYAVKIFECDVR